MISELKSRPIVCVICEEKDDAGRFDPRCSSYERMTKNSWCFTCAFWKEKIEHKDEYTIIDGHSYFVHPGITKSISGFGLGFGGQRFKVRYLSDGRVVESNNVWHQGLIPERFRAELPDTGEFVYEAKV